MYVQVKQKLYTIFSLSGKKLETLIKEYHAWLPPLLTIFDDLKGVARLNFSEKKAEIFFHIFSLHSK